MKNKKWSAEQHEIQRRTGKALYAFYLLGPDGLTDEITGPCDPQRARQLSRFILHLMLLHPSEAFRKAYPSEHNHRYSCACCPACGCDLGREGGVVLQFVLDYLSHNFPSNDFALCDITQSLTMPSRLDADGFIVDVADLVRNGYHSDTLCGGCGVSMSEYEVVKEKTDG